jgi:hypothetical protein
MAESLWIQDLEKNEVPDLSKQIDKALKELQSNK